MLKDRLPSFRLLRLDIGYQNILWLILRSYFDDLIDEETLPKFGRNSYKPDFAIPSLRLLIEAKLIYDKNGFSKVEKGIAEDSIGYLINTKLKMS